ncbi:hypothetical protein VaNZ11_008920, partial [Volvox africanus]
MTITAGPIRTESLQIRHVLQPVPALQAQAATPGLVTLHRARTPGPMQASREFTHNTTLGQSAAPTDVRASSRQTKALQMRIPIPILKAIQWVTRHLISNNSPIACRIKAVWTRTSEWMRIYGPHSSNPALPSA